MSDNEAYFIFFTWYTVVEADVGYNVDSDMKADKDSAFVNVGDNICIFALNFVLNQVGFAGIAIDTLYISFYRDILQRVDSNIQDAYTMERKNREELGILADLPVYSIPYPQIKKIAAVKNHIWGL